MIARSPGAAGRSAVAALVVACLIAGLLQTVIIPIQSDLPGLLDAPRSLTAWVVTATAAGAAAFTPISGRIGDVYGRKRAAIAVMMVFTLGSVMAAVTSNVGTLIAARAIQGIAIGVIPLSVSIMREIVSAHRLPGAIALASGMLGGGAAFGMPIGAVTARWLDWHAIFWFCVILGVAASVWLWRSVPDSSESSSGRFDVIGAMGTVVGAAALIVGLAQGVEWGWSSRSVLLLMLSGGSILVATNVWMLRARDPLIDVRVALRRPVLFTNMAALGINFANMGCNVVFPQLMAAPRTVGLEMDSITVSLVMMLSATSQMLATPLVAAAGRRLASRTMLVLGATIGSTAIAAPAFFIPRLWIIVLVNVVIGVCLAFVFSAFPQIIMASVPAAQIATANGLNAQIRTFGTSAGAAVPGAVLAVMAGPSGPTSAAFTSGLLLCSVVGLIAAGVGVFATRRRTEERGGYRTSG